jgi:hypothetical protein
MMKLLNKILLYNHCKNIEQREFGDLSSSSANRRGRICFSFYVLYSVMTNESAGLEA